MTDITATNSVSLRAQTQKSFPAKDIKQAERFLNALETAEKQGETPSPEVIAEGRKIEDMLEVKLWQFGISMGDSSVEITEKELQRVDEITNKLRSSLKMYRAAGPS
jgi:hypothetical protein